MNDTSEVTSSSRIGINRRIGDLRKQLLEIVVKRLVLVRQNRQRRIVAHRADGLFAVRGHRHHQELDVFLRVSKRLLAVEQRHARALGTLPVAFDVVELHADALDPFAVRLGVGERVL
jgi:hypothetical protein